MSAHGNHGRPTQGVPIGAAAGWNLRRMAASTIAVLIAAHGGCRQGGWAPSLFKSPHESRAGLPGGAMDRTPPRRPPSARSSITVVRLVFDVFRADLPVGAAQDARKVWNHVDTLRLDPEVIARFARNGLRIGAVTPASWPAIETILDAPQTQLRREQVAAIQGQALALEMAKVTEAESIFVYGSDRRAAGKTFQAGDKLITVDSILQAGARDHLDVHIGFEIRNDLGVMTWKRENGGVREVPAFDRHVFKDIEAAMTLAPKESLVIGLSAQADNEYLLGRRFLTIERDGHRYESLLFLTPQSFRTQAPINTNGT